MLDLDYEEKLEELNEEYLNALLRGSELEEAWDLLVEQILKGQNKCEKRATNCLKTTKHLWIATKGQFSKKT